MSKAEEMLNKLKMIKGTKLIVFLGIAGIAAIFLSEILFSGDKSEMPVANKSGSEGYDSYVSQSELRLAEMLEKIDGVGKAEVMLTVSGTEEYIYAEEEKSDRDSDHTSKENKYVVIGGSSGKEALLKRVNNPEISGVAVVCEGGDSSVVKERVIDAVSSVLDIPAKKIFVAKIR